MQEVTIRLRFTSPCLGRKPSKSKAGQTFYKLPRDGDDRVIFLLSWWHECMQFAANLRNRNQKIVKSIVWDQVVDGQIKLFRRQVNDTRKRKRRGFAIHEAFASGDMIGIRAVLPNGLSIEECADLLVLVGKYRGISWFQSEDVRYGTFELESINPTRVAKVTSEE